MTTEELQQIVDFVNETEEMLVEHDGGAVDPALFQLYQNIIGLC